MTDLVKDVVVTLSAIGGGIGLFVTGFNFARSRNGYVKEVRCREIKNKDDMKLSDLHEKINTVSDRVSKIEGRLMERE